MVNADYRARFGSAARKAYSRAVFAATGGTPTPTPSGLVIDWRTPLTAITDLSGTSDAAMLSQQQNAASKGRNAFFSIAAGATAGRIIDLPASTQPILASWDGMKSTSTATVEISTDGGATWADQSWASNHPGGVTSVADRRQRHIFAPGGAGRKARITISAGTIGITVMILVHTRPASGVEDSALLIGASREDLLTSGFFEAALIAEQPDRDPVIWNYGISAASASSIAGSMTQMMATFPAGDVGSVLIGSVIGNNVSDGRPYTSGQKASLDTAINTIIDAAIATAGAADRVVMMNTSYRNYTTTGTSTQGPATPPSSQVGGSLEYNSNVVDPRIAARLPHAYDPTLLRAREDEYLFQLAKFNYLTDEVHPTDSGKVELRNFHARSAFLFLRYGTWPASQMEQRIATVETSSLQADYDAATYALAAIDPSATAKAAFQSRLVATIPAVKTKSADVAVYQVEATRLQADKDAAQTAIDNAVAVQNSATTPQNAALQTRLNAVVIVTVDQVVMVNFGSNTVAGWNSFNSTTNGFAVVLTTDGAALAGDNSNATGLTLTMNSSANSASPNGGIALARTVDGRTFPSGIGASYLSKNGYLPFTLSGADGGKKYDVYLLSARGAGGPINVRHTIAGVQSGDLDEASGSGPVTSFRKDVVPSGGALIFGVGQGTGNTSFAHTNGAIIVRHT